LFDGGTVTVTAAQNDQQYGGPTGVRLVESITFAASIPTRTAYQNKVATSPEVVIASSVEYYRSNIWIKRTSYVNLI
jgi:hypothetical protein